MYVNNKYIGNKIVSLFGLVQLGLIIKCSSGAHYTNQAGGIGCYHPIEEGILTIVGDGEGEADND